MTITKEQYDIAMRIINITSSYGIEEGIDSDDKAYELYTKFECDIDKMEERIEALFDGDKPLNNTEKYIESKIW